VSAVPDAELIISPFKLYLARKHANEAPAGPAPTIRRSISTNVEVGERNGMSTVGRVCWGIVEAMVAVCGVDVDAQRYS
jgi:hypothetical protein